MSQAIDTGQLTLRLAGIAEIIDLRRHVLLHGWPAREAGFPGDDEPTTHHFGAFLHGANIACATYMLNAWDGESAWQLRGMATADGFRGRGVGSALVEAAERELTARSPVRLMWCQAREPAIGFYERHGWQVASERYVIERFGPHVKMFKRW